MKHLLLFSILAFSLVLKAQETGSNLRKFQIGESGCAVYLPATDVDWDVSVSEDSSYVCTGEVTKDNFNYFVIAVKFKEPFTDVTSKDMEDLLISYLDYLKGQFSISGSAGYGKGHPVEGHDISAGVIDFWEGDDGSQWSVKGQVTNTHLGITGVYGYDDPSDNSLTNVVLNGFVFPEGN
jgi:hypothetical protein